MEIQQLQPENDERTLLKMLAAGDDNAVRSVDGEKLIDTTKLFLIAQAKSELTRIIRNTDFLDRLEQKFMDAVDSRLEDNPDNLQLISASMEVVVNSLKRSNEIVTQVLKDDKLSSIIINTTNIITPDGSSATIIDADSRDSVRNMASSLLAQLQNAYNESEKSDSDVVEVEVSDESIDNGGDSNG